MRVIFRYFKIYAIQIKNNWVREAVYRTNFLTSIVVDLVWICVELSLFAVIYSNVSSLAGWTRDQVYFFLGLFFATDAVFTTFFQMNFWRFSDLVNKGELDILLTKPVHPLFLALTRWINLTSIFNISLGIYIMVTYAKTAGFKGGASWLLVPSWMLFGVFTQLLIRFLFSVWVFWTDRSWAISRLYYQFFAFSTKPDSIYPKMIRYLILTVLPFAFIASVPARALLHGIDLNEYLKMLCILTFTFLLNAFLWKLGLRRYQSASS